MPSCYFCGHTDDADLTTRATETRGTIVLCANDRECIHRMAPLIAAEAGRRDPAFARDLAEVDPRGGRPRK